MSVDAPLVAGFNEEEDDAWLYGEAGNANDETSSEQITEALVESKVIECFNFSRCTSFFF